MIKIVPLIVGFALLFSLNFGVSEPALGKKDVPRMPKVEFRDELLLLDINTLKQVRKEAVSNSSYKAAIDSILQFADKALEMSALSVTQNDSLPESGDPHDYFSVGPYWWPNPDTQNGLPWINKDGQVNWEMRGPDTDSKLFQTLVTTAEALSLAYFFSDDVSYARKAEALCRAWFIEKHTRMNPHLQYAQSIPGRTSGRGIGIIEWRAMPRLLDSLTLIQRVSEESFKIEMDTWLREFFSWLVRSKNGKDEAAMHNNHGSFYDATVVSLALFLGYESMAKQFINTSKQRITDQISVDGSQKHELARTRPFHYSAFNLTAFNRTAKLAERVDIDLWNYPSEQDRRLYKAYRFMVDNLDDTTVWTGAQERPPYFDKLISLGIRMQKVFADHAVVQRISVSPENIRARAQQCALVFGYPLKLTPVSSSTGFPCNY